MNRRSSPAARPTDGAEPPPGHWRSDPRLPGYLVAGFGGLLAALVTGQPEFAALGAPFAVLAAAGLRRGGPVNVRGRVSLDGTRVLEGDLLKGEVRIEWNEEAEVDVRLAGWRGVRPVDPAPVVGWSLPPGAGPAALPFRLRARAWGDHDLGTLWVRVRRSGSLLVWEQELARAPRLRVLPSPLRLDRLLHPAEPRAVAGMHLSRLRGRGTDFAELRPYQPGDRLRDLSWTTSARLGTPWVIVHHPERTGTVLLVLDAFYKKGGTRPQALARAVRAAWSVASVHLRAQDRVGLLAHGMSAAWLPPRGGRRAQWMLLDQLLTIGGAAASRPPGRRRGRAVVPADALIVGVTSLRSGMFVRSLLHYRRAGHTTVALVIDTSDLLPQPEDRVDEAARRLWLADRDAQRHVLDRGGVPTALVTPSGGVGPAISALRRRTKRHRALPPRGRA